MLSLTWFPEELSLFSVCFVVTLATPSVKKKYLKSGTLQRPSRGVSSFYFLQCQPATRILIFFPQVSSLCGTKLTMPLSPIAWWHYHFRFDSVYATASFLVLFTLVIIATYTSMKLLNHFPHSKPYAGFCSHSQSYKLLLLTLSGQWNHNVWTPKKSLSRIFPLPQNLAITPLCHYYSLKNMY